MDEVNTVACGKWMLIKTLRKVSPEHGQHWAYTVLNSRDQQRLGNITWYFRWKKYVFEPSSDALFDAKCLRDLARFIEGLDV